MKVQMWFKEVQLKVLLRNTMVHQSVHKFANVVLVPVRTFFCTVFFTSFSSVLLSLNRRKTGFLSTLHRSQIHRMRIGEEQRAIQESVSPSTNLLGSYNVSEKTGFCYRGHHHRQCCISAIINGDNWWGTFCLYSANHRGKKGEKVGDGVCTLFRIIALYEKRKLSFFFCNFKKVNVPFCRAFT